MDCEPSLDVHVAHGPGSVRTWRIRCGTFGWEIAGTGPRPATADESAAAHRCGR